MNFFHFFLLSFFFCNYVVSVSRVYSSSWCLGWATLFYFGTPWAFHIIIKKYEVNQFCPSTRHHSYLVKKTMSGTVNKIE